MKIRNIISIFAIFAILMLVITTATAVMYAPPQPTISKVTMQTDKNIYYLGETVKITVKNGLRESIYFNEIMAKNINTGKIINICSGSDANACPAGIITGQTYTTTWYPPSKGIYRTYIDWWTPGTATCLAIGCPPPEPGISARTYSNYFIVYEPTPIVTIEPTPIATIQPP